jgi:hypothetical protein
MRHDRPVDEHNQAILDEIAGRLVEPAARVRDFLFTADALVGPLSGSWTAPSMTHELRWIETQPQKNAAAPLYSPDSATFGLYACMWAAMLPPAWVSR